MVMTNTINTTYAPPMMGRLNMKTSNNQRLSGILIDWIFMEWYTEVFITIITFIILYCLRTLKLLLYFFRTFRSFPKFKDFTLPNVFVTFFVPEHFCVNFRRKPCLALFRTNSKDIFWTFHRAGYAHCWALGVKAHFPQFQTLPSSQLTEPEKYKESDGLCLLRD